jgi:hypothetical protein
VQEQRSVSVLSFSEGSLALLSLDCFSVRAFSGWAWPPEKQVRKVGKKSLGRKSAAINLPELEALDS